MLNALTTYRQLELRLWMTRWRNAGGESAEEDLILDEMEEAWMGLSKDEQEMLQLEGPRCWPMDSSNIPPEFARALYSIEAPVWGYEGFESPLETILSDEAA